MSTSRRLWIALSLLLGATFSVLLWVGVLQPNAVLEHGYWYARSAEFMGRPMIHLLNWMRVPGDTIFAIGALLIAWFVARLWIAPRRVKAISSAEETLSHG